MRSRSLRRAKRRTALQSPLDARRFALARIGSRLLDEFPLEVVPTDCERYGRAGSYGRDRLVARFGAVTALPDLLMTLATWNFGGTSHGHAARGSLTWRRSGNNSGRFDAAGPMRAPPKGREAQPHIYT